MPESVLLIDGLNLFTRHYIANPTMSDNGHHMGGTAGFLKAIRLLSEKNPSKLICVVWEGGGSPRRRAIFPEYKKGSRPQKLNRFYAGEIPDTVENRDYQLALTIELLKHVPILQLYVADCEADDVIGYLVKYKFSNENIVIVSSDKDFYQLVNDRVVQWSPGQKRYINSSLIIDKFGIHPENFCVARCFCGDPSDALPGIKGAGFRTLARHFPELTQSEFVPVSEIIKLGAERAKVKPLKIFRAIAANPAVAERNWKLMHLDLSNLAADQIKKIEYCVDTFEPKRDKIGLMRILLREGLSSFDANTFYMILNSSIKGT